MANHPKALAHGPIQEIFPDVFQVVGTFRFGPGITIPRTMTVVREGGELTLLNAVRLSDEGHAELDKLGKVRHLVKVGDMHGADHPFLVERYRPTLHACAGARHAEGVVAEGKLDDGAPLHLAGSRGFVFRVPARPEAAVLLEREGGILITCDSVQHWTTLDDCSWLARPILRGMGWKVGCALIGPGWRKQFEPKGAGFKPDFDRLLTLEFRHLLSAHFAPLKDRAKDEVTKAVAQAYPS
jgi:hypothetical protein